VYLLFSLCQWKEAKTYFENCDNNIYMCNNILSLVSSVVVDHFIFMLLCCCSLQKKYQKNVMGPREPKVTISQLLHTDTEVWSNSTSHCNHHGWKSKICSEEQLWSCQGSPYGIR